MTYYGIAKNADGKFEQMLITVGQRNDQFTGVVYKSWKQACTDIARLNGCAA